MDMGMKQSRMQYKGLSRDIAYNPWMRLIHGRHYDVEIHKMRSGKIRVRVIDDIDVSRITYDSLHDFNAEWC